MEHFSIFVSKLKIQHTFLQDSIFQDSISTIAIAIILACHPYRRVSHVTRVIIVGMPPMLGATRCTGATRYNLGKGVRDEFTNLSKIGFSIESFTADFLRFFTKKRQKVALGCAAGYSPSNPSISGIFFKFPNFLNPRFYVVRQFMWQLVYSHSVDNNLVLFRLWWREIMLRSEKVYKYFVQDCITPPMPPMLVSYPCKQTARATLASTLAQHPQKQATHINYTCTLPTQRKLAQISYHFWNSV